MNRWSSRAAVQSPWSSKSAVEMKLSRLVSNHKQVKIAFKDLNAQIGTGLREAEDVFTSLALPLMHLVGLKSVQMASEGRFTTIFRNVDESVHQSLPTQDECDVRGVLTSGNELIDRQRQQLIQLVKLLKSIEAQVKSSQNSIYKSLADHQNDMENFFKKAFTYVSHIQQSSQNNELSITMLKLLKATYQRVEAVLGSVEGGVDEMISVLAQKMCQPMVNYVKVLKLETESGTFPRLLEVIKELNEAMRLRNFELKEARLRTLLAEESRIKTLNNLAKSEEMTRRLTISLELLTDDGTESGETSARPLVQQEQSLNVKEDQSKDDNLLWEMLKKRKRCQVPESPIGPEGLQGIQKRGKGRTMPAYNLRFSNRSQTKGLDPLSSFVNSRLLLGSSPSAVNQRVLRSQRRTP